MELHVTQLNSPHYIWIKGSPSVVSPTIGGKLDPRMVLNGGPSVGWYQILCLENLELDHTAMAVKLGHHPDDLPRAQVEGFRQLVWGGLRQLDRGIVLRERSILIGPNL